MDKKVQHVKKKLFYVQSGNGTRPITDSGERERYTRSRSGVRSRALYRVPA